MKRLGDLATTALAFLIGVTVIGVAFYLVATLCVLLWRQVWAP